MERHHHELWLMIGVKLAGVLVVGYAVWWGLTLFQGKEERWPPSDPADEDRIIAQYKHRLLIGDTPVSSLKPETAAIYLGRIIDHAVKKGDLKTAREYAGSAIDRKADATATMQMTQQEAKSLLAHMLAGRVKRDDLQRIADIYTKRPPDSAAKEVRDAFNRDLGEAVRDFLGTRFSPDDCPELAAEIVGIFKSRLEPHKADPRLKAVAEEVEISRPRKS